MPASLEHALRHFLLQAKGLLKSNQTIRSLLSDTENKDEFSNLFEHDKMLADSARVD